MLCFLSCSISKLLSSQNLKPKYMCLSPIRRKQKQQQRPEFNIDQNPVYMAHNTPQPMTITEQQQQQQEPEIDMEHNPLYMLHNRSQHGSETSEGHEYETVAVNHVDPPTVV